MTPGPRVVRVTFAYPPDSPAPTPPRQGCHRERPGGSEAGGCRLSERQPPVGRHVLPRAGSWAGSGSRLGSRLGARRSGHPALDPAKVGWVVPLAAQSLGDVRFVVTVSASLTPIAEDNRFERARNLSRSLRHEGDQVY